MRAKNKNKTRAALALLFCIRACLHGGGGPQVDEEARVGEVRDCAIIIRRGGGGGAEKLGLSSKNLDSTPPPKQKN